MKSCSCGRSKPSNEPAEKVRIWFDHKKIQSGEVYNPLDIPEWAQKKYNLKQNDEQLVRSLLESPFDKPKK